MGTARALATFALNFVLRPRTTLRVYRLVKADREANEVVELEGAVDRYLRDRRNERTLR